MFDKKNIQSQDSRSKETEKKHSGDSLIAVTKINKPTFPSNLIVRNSLIKQLEKNRNIPLTLVSAPTGCGKSITVSQWLNSTKNQYGWLSLDRDLNDVNVLLAYLSAIIKQQRPKKDFGIEHLVSCTNLSAHVIASTFINDISNLDEVFFLVLDDYHLIMENKIHEIFNNILRYPPENLRLVIITRIDPPLELVSLRAKSQLIELRMEDLVFTVEEANELGSLIADEIPSNNIKQLVKRSEGWITGITIGLMAMSQGIKFEEVLKAFHSRNSIIAQLFEEAVLKGLPIQTQKYLQISSLVDQFSANLIEAMLNSIKDQDFTQISIEEHISASKKRNLFLISLDSFGEWFRFHHLFQSQIKNLAKRNFSKDEISLMYKAASRWFEDNGTLDEALKYAIMSKDLAYAVGLLTRCYHELFNTEQIQRLDRMINQFPKETISNNLVLLIITAMLQDHKANFTGMRQYLARAEELFNVISVWGDNEKQLFGEFHSVSTYLSFMLGDLHNAIKHGEKSMELLPSKVPNFYREFAVGWYAFAQQAIGNAHIGLERLEHEFQPISNTDNYFHRRFLQGKCLINLMEVNLSFLGKDGIALANICNPKTNIDAWFIGLYSVLFHLYQTNQFEKIFSFHDDIWLFRYAGRPFWVIQALFIEFLAGIVAGIKDQADLYLNQIDELAEELAIEPLIGMVKAFKVDLFLRQNDIDRAVELSYKANFEPYPPLFYYYIPQLTQVKLLYHTNQRGKGKALLQHLLEEGRKRHNKNFLIQVLVLQAVIFADEKDYKKSKITLNEVLLLTKEINNIRVFLDYGEPVYQILREMAKDHPEDKQIIDLLQAFENDFDPYAKSEPVSTGIKVKEANDLSSRELEILFLVSKGLKNKEIAGQLFISIDAVKKHLYRSYQKLEVRNRISAVKKLMALGLLPHAD